MNESFIRSLMYNPERHGINILQFLRAMFVHADYRHMLSNLSSMLSLGYSVHQEFGPVVTNSAFLVGGLVSFLSFDEVTKFINSNSKQLPKKNMDWKSIATDFTKRQFYHCGSSGGVFALFGCNFVVVAKKMFEAVQEYRSFQKQQRFRPVSQAHLIYRESHLWDKVQHSLLSMFSMSLCILNEYTSAREQSYVNKSSVLDVFIPKTLIGHEAHLKGFLTGATISIGCLYFKYRYFNSVRYNRPRS